MADVQPLRALHYDLAEVGSLDAVARPALRRDRPPSSAPRWPRARPTTSSTIDLPAAARRRPVRRGRASCSSAGSADGARRPRRRARAVGARRRTTPAPTAARCTRHGVFARVRVEDYGPGRIRPHERTHPGPKEDRLRLTRATQANLSPIFSLYDDPGDAAWSALAPHDRRAVGRARPTTTAPSTGSGASPTRAAIARVPDALADAELLIADGHHRYETARVYAEEIGGEGEHRYVLMCLVALAGPGPDRLPHAPAARATRRPTRRRRSATTLRELLRRRADRAGDLRAAGRRRPADASATSTRTSPAAPPPRR